MGKPHRVTTQFQLNIKRWEFHSPTKLQHNKKGKLMHHGVPSPNESQKGRSFLRIWPSYFYLDEQD